MKISGIIYNNYFYLGGCYEYEFLNKGDKIGVISCSNGLSIKIKT